MATVPARLIRLVAGAFLAVAAAMLSTAEPAGGPVVQPGTASPGRIVSLIPATTEMLFAMGAAERLAAVGAYDRFPPEVEQLPRVGGVLDPNVEKILSMKPDLVIVYRTQDTLRRQLERAGIPMFIYEHRGLSDIAETMRAIGARIGFAGAADAAASRMEKQMADVRARVAGRPRPRTLLIFGREPGSLRRIDASGGYGFLHDVLEVAGGSDVLADFKRQSVQMSTEMILSRAPDVIIELQYGDSARRKQLASDLRVWDALPSVPAVRNRRVHLLVGDEFVVPGPRIALAADRFARTLHPETFK
jgi:iron complex transport system substrate-binding protein